MSRLQHEISSVLLQLSQSSQTFGVANLEQERVDVSNGPEDEGDLIEAVYVDLNVPDGGLENVATVVWRLDIEELLLRECWEVLVA